MGPPTGAAGRAASKSPKHPAKPSPPRQDAQFDTKRDAPLKAEDAAPVEPLAPPPRPAQQQGSNSPDYFGNPAVASLSLEPNPFEQSFGGAPPETPGGTKLPSVAALTSPSSLLPGNTPFAWGGGSLRTGPLSPAMLSGPAADYFSEAHHIRGGFPTPNESSLRTGLTPGGSGSMFPAPSPNSQALFTLAGPAPTPGTIDFHRTALSAAAAKREQGGAQQPPLPVGPTSQPHDISGNVQPTKTESKTTSGPFDPHDPHDKDAANGLFLLAQGHNGTQAPPVSQYPAPPLAQMPTHHATSGAPAVQPMSTSPQMNGAPSLTGSSVRGVSEASAGSDESEMARPNTRSRGKRAPGGATTNSRRKAEEPLVKAPATKKAKSNGGAASISGGDNDFSDDEQDDKNPDDSGSKSKMTDEEKRKNFLERNRVAALKCRQRKKQWLANLQHKVEVFSSENDALNHQITSLREEVVSLKTLLLAHKDCPVTQQQGMHNAAMLGQLDAAYPQQINPYGVGIPQVMAQQPVMAGQGINARRFS